MKGPSLYAFKGMAGRFAPIGVHIAMLLIMAGGTYSASGAFRGSVTVPQGLNFVMGDVLQPNGLLSTPTEAFNTEVHVNRFYMDYYDSGEVGNMLDSLAEIAYTSSKCFVKMASLNDMNMVYTILQSTIKVYESTYGVAMQRVRQIC